MITIFTSGILLILTSYAMMYLGLFLNFGKCYSLSRLVPTECKFDGHNGIPLFMYPTNPITIWSMSLSVIFMFNNKNKFFNKFFIGKVFYEENEKV